MPLPLDYSQFLVSLASAKFRTLWPAQAYVLQEYAQTFVPNLHTTATSGASPNSDVAVELPTGAGKTLIALLIAEAWRREGKVAAILSANKTLARQMQVEAQALGIPSVLMEGKGQDIPAPDKRAYGRANKIAIMNYWVYFNQNPVIDVADLLIMDDAHLAEHCLQTLYSIEIDRHAHKNLFDELVTELQSRFPEYSVLHSDADASFSSPTELLSFLDQVTVAERVREIIDVSPYLREGEGRSDLGFRWGRLRDRLVEANVYLSSHSIWIRPYIYPLLSNERYEQVSQRIYMSATVGDPADLSRRLGVRQISKIPVPPKYAERTSGRRLIVMNRVEDADLAERLQHAILAALRVHPKSVWLCSSSAEAAKFKDLVYEWLNSNGLVGHPTWILTPLGDEIDQFKRAPKGHLFVAGRFDGMDFREDECRLVVLTTLPRAVNTQEAFLSAYVRDSGFLTRRLNQRIVQALGRCNRSDDDYGIYVFADRRFATHFGIEANKRGLPSNIVAEIDMAQDTAEIAPEELAEEIERFMRGDFASYDRRLSEYHSEVPASKIDREATDPDGTSKDEVLGWNALFTSQNYAIAASRFESCWSATGQSNRAELSAFHGWHWSKSLYLQGVKFNDAASRSKAFKTLEDVIQRGGQSAWFNRLRASLNRHVSEPRKSAYQPELEYIDALIRALDEHLERLTTKGTRFEKWCAQLTEMIESESHAQYQEGLERLGTLLGYQASRPRHQGATDCRWYGVFGNSREVVTFEAKVEHSESGQIDMRDVGQAHNQQSRAENEYPGFTVRSTIVTHLSQIAPSAEASLGTIRILEKHAVLDLWKRVRTLLSLYRDKWSMDDIQVRRAAAQSVLSQIPRTGWFIRAFDKVERTLTAAELCAEWGVRSE
jgi:Helicase C-terminal domain/DEAD/DEAH box helicase